MNSQPKALYLLNFISMWEYFSYYGMRALLVLFMVQAMQLGDTEAFGIYALYITLGELGGMIGGLIADRFLGLKRSILLGGWTIALGHLCLTFPESKSTFYLGLGFIIAGTCLFRSNVAAFLGEFYTENDPRRDAGYTLYYTGINIGGFLAGLICGIAGEVWGWHFGFGLAALGMLAGNIALIAGHRILAGKGELTGGSSTKSTLIGIVCLIIAGPLFGWILREQDSISSLLPIIAIALIAYACFQARNYTNEEKLKLKMLGLYTLFLILFYACEEQLGSSLVLFSERHIERSFFSWIIPASSLITFNPLTILIAGPLLSRFIGKWNLSSLTKIGISFLFLGAAFCVLYGGCLVNSESNSLSLGYAIGSIVLIALGEVLIGPTIYAAASAAAPKHAHGFTMGIVTLGYSFANLFSGFLSQMMAVTDAQNSLSVYAEGFNIVGIAALLLAFILLYINKRTTVLIPC